MLIIIFFYFLQLLIYQPLVLTLEIQCDPTFACYNSSPGKKVIDPLNCRNYYICIENEQGDVYPSDESFECPSYYYFNGRSCSYGNCKENCTKSCLTKCEKYAYERIADNANCSLFYSCYPNQSLVGHVCPLYRPYFDGIACSENEFSCCMFVNETTPAPTCNAYCESAFSETQDPYDCHKYYYCPSPGPAHPSNLFYCDEGKYFDPISSSCEFEEESKPCVSLC